MSKKILISGAGIAGLTLAYWLKKFGFEPTVVEQASKPRQGGYMIDFYGAGFTVAVKMGLAEALKARDARIQEIAFVDEKDRKTGGMDAAFFRRRLKGEACSLPSGSLAEMLYSLVSQNVKFIFGKSIRHLDNQPGKVSVHFDDHDGDSYDAVIGADGRHSNVRNLVFGEETLFEQYLGYYAASFTVPGSVGEGPSYRRFTVPGKSAAVCDLGNGRSAALFIFHSRYRLPGFRKDVSARRKILRDVFQKEGWKCRSLLEKMDESTDFHFDSVSQIRMNGWFRGRTAVVGDAAYCPSLLSGHGASMAMAGAYVLAGELMRVDGDTRSAFLNYGNRMADFVRARQEIGRRVAGTFIPSSPTGVWMRNKLAGIATSPVFGRIFMRRLLKDGISLPDY